MGEGERGQPLAVRDRWLAAFIAVGLVVLYYAFRTHYQHCDAIKTATSIDAPEIGIFLHQNHLAFTPLIWLLLKGLRPLGYGGSPLALAAAVSSIFTGAAAAGFFLLLRRVGVTLRASLLALGAATFSAAWWFYAGGAEQRSAIPFFIVGALLLLAAPARRWYSAAAVAVWLSVGAWFHISITLFFPVAAILLAQNKEGRWLRLSILGAIYAVLAFLPYVLIFRLFYRGTHGGSFYKWITFLHWWGGWGRFDWSRFWDGALRLFAAAVAPGDRLNCLLTGISWAEFVPRLGPGAVFLAAVIAVVAVKGKRLWREKRWWLAAGITWFLVYHIFFSWWAPQNAEWWVATIMPLWILFGLAAPTRLAFVLPAAAVIACVAAVNFTRLILPTSRPGRDPAERAACVIATATQPGDVILISRMRTAIWLDNQTKRTRIVGGSGGRSELKEVKEFINDVTRPSPKVKGGRGDAFLTDYELDNADLGPGVDGNKMRASLFRIIRNAEPVALVPFNGWPRVLYRCRGAAKLKPLRIYEAERGTQKKEFRVLRDAGNVKRFNVKVPKEGRYVVCVQARGTFAGGEWPAAWVAVDGKALSTFVVTSDYWWFYETRAALDAGEHEIKITLRNGMLDRATGEKRFLYLNRLAVYRDPGEERGAGKLAEERRPPFPLD
ncbi:MAG TPA: carbohydrate-binding domain-containing protein [bacterium]|nr:carbohydrate-binding domain-containing protein [bacterium]